MKVRLGRNLPALLLAVLAMLVAGCTSSPRSSYTALQASNARVLDLATLRRYADDPAASFSDDTDQIIAKGSLSYLALSGGGADGAYGAGVLNGWTESGNRPTFSIVSGVSTGALIAPFAYLGPAYDETLKNIYTSGIAGSLLDSPNLLNAFFGSGLFGNARLRELVARFVDQDMLSAIAAQYAKGRLLFVVTTNLDSQRTVIWNMGRIAAIGSSESLNLFRNVLAASASIPVVFPPILIDATSDGKQFQEMHVDGGVTAPILTLPDAFLLRDARLSRTKAGKIYIIINNKIDPDFQLVPNKTIEIAARSSSTVTKTQTRSVIYNTYGLARRNGFEFNMTYVEGDVPSSTASGFDTEYMRSLFQYGYDKARTGNLWSKAPPLGTGTRADVVNAGELLALQASRSKGPN